MGGIASFATIYAVTLCLRMDEVKRRLREPAEPISDIARDCGECEGL